VVNQPPLRSLSVKAILSVKVAGVTPLPKRPCARRVHSASHAALKSESWWTSSLSQDCFFVFKDISLTKCFVI
jgi:hypothetical protein